MITGLSSVAPVLRGSPLLSARTRHHNNSNLRQYASLERVPKTQSYPRKRKRRPSDELQHRGGSAHVPTAIQVSPRLFTGVRDNKYKYIVLDKKAPPLGGKTAELPLLHARMKSHVQFITTPTVDTPGSSLILHFDNKRYLFGHLHEGFQRSLMQQKLSQSKVTDVFLTGRTGWATTGGMIGMILSLADGIQAAAHANAEREKEIAQSRKERMKDPTVSEQTKKKLERDHNIAKKALNENAKRRLTIHGGANLLHTLATGRKFMFRQGLPIYVNEYDQVVPNESNLSESTWSDENIRVWAIPIRPVSDQSSPRDVSVPTRKRSYQEYLDPKPSVQNNADAAATAQSESHDNGLKILRSIVSDMFDSEWRLDALVEKRLADVQMPAAIFVRNSETRKIEKYQGPKPKQAGANPDLTVLVRRPWPGALIAQLPPSKPSPVSMCYIVRNHPQRGKFNAKKAQELNIEPGPKFSKLTAGESVLSRDGQTVTPEQVLEPGKAGGGFVIADVPSADYLQDLLAQPHWGKPDVLEGVGAVVWLLGPGVINDPAFQDFINKRTDLEHIVSSPEVNANRLSMDSAAAATIRHCQIDPDRYSLPKHNNTAAAVPEQISVKVADRGLILNLEPRLNITDDQVIKPLNTAQVVQGAPSEVLKLAQVAQAELLKQESIDQVASQGLPSPDTQVVTLGTGSALPSKFRNVSSTLVRVPGIGSYLLDCGENTLGQLSRIFNQQELQEILLDLKMIWISHLHADHHLGTTSLIKAWNAANRENNEPNNNDNADPATTFFASNGKPTRKLFVAAEPAMIDWIREYSTVEDIGYDNLVPLAVRGARRGAPDSTVLYWKGQALDFNDPSALATRALQSGTGLTRLAAAPVPHCHGAMAVSLTFPTGLKVSYSGDCRPSKDFVDIGQNTTILIHEATFDDDMRGDAIAKKHSTTSEAVGVGVAMKARRIVLTHFSQRYQNIPSLDALQNTSVKLESSAGQEDVPAGVESNVPGNSGQEPSGESVKVAPTREKDLKVIVAFDYMQVKLKDIASLEKFNAAFIKLYENASQEPAEDSLD